MLIRDNYTCQRTFRLCSGRPGEPDSAVVNHIVPHRGNEALFWDPANLQTVTKQVHDSLIQAEEQDSRHQQGVWT
ncbi:MAG: HNH endonuclease [Alphaproteobacteria bacterium]|nr:MAG: HNH endonuclease [Alphaproteobacteria bacterium]